jgi:radical SAM superfamily enzyme YgiQ (UPF0313 family)
MAPAATPSPDRPHLLLVNPWIHDFAAYDFWAKPYGLLQLGGMLRAAGVHVSYIDCLDRFHRQAPPADPRQRHGRGAYLKTAIPKPAALADIPRHFSRYGIAPEWLRTDLSRLARPDLILVTSIMTYWYPGVVETIAVLRECFGAVPIVLGGIYARLCREHAQAVSGADLVAPDNGESLPDLLREYMGFDLPGPFAPWDLDRLPYPAFDLQHRVGAVPLLTARGCPYDCAYCANRFLQPRMARRSPESVTAEIAHWHHNFGVTDFAFYDDALLVDAEKHALPMLEGIVRLRLPLRFHTPNALHIRNITAATARAMFAAGFHTLRLGLETTAFEERAGLDRKVTAAEFAAGVGHLKAAGFKSSQIGAYLLVGLPGQSLSAVEESIDLVKATGIMPIPAHYTPIPHTRLWPEAVAASRYDLSADPIFANNALFPCRREGFSWEALSRIKQRCLKS